MKSTLTYLFEGHTLTKTEAQEALTRIASGQCNAGQIASFLTVFRMRNITVEELEGFRDTMLNLCIPVNLSAYNPIDLCGTGGDAKNTFNISTLAAFVTAGAGIRVAKHGNYGISSVSGSSDLMEALGFKFTSDTSMLEKQIEKAGICFMHAPLFHPAMKHVAPVRKELGLKTFFNMLGPMVNPARPRLQYIGVFNLELARLYSYLYQQTDKEYIIVHTLDGYDELSLTSPCKLIARTSEKTIDPEVWGFGRLSAADLDGGRSVDDAAKIFTSVLNNTCTNAQREAVIANAAIAIQCAKADHTMEECISLARESLVTGNAKKSFEKLMSCVP